MEQVSVNRKAGLTLEFTEELLSDPEFNSEAFAISKLDSWAAGVGGTRDERYKPVLIELIPETEEEVAHARKLHVKCFRILARYWVPENQTA